MRNLPFALTLATSVMLSACAGGSPDVRPAVSAPTAAPAYLARSHSHNNYEQPRPLVDAMERGFASIEVDVVLVDDELYVAHGLEDVRPTATLTRLYLDPLREVVRRNGGFVHGAGHPPLQLLVDVKSDAEATYDVLRGVLADYSDILTTWDAGVTRSGPVSVVLSGNRALGPIAAEPLGYVAVDGRVLDDRSSMSPEAMPLVSEDWERLGPPSTDARLAAARDLVERVHAEGRQVRFWGTPEDENLWRSLLEMGVDYIGTDEPVRLERLLRAMESEASRTVD